MDRSSAVIDDDIFTGLGLNDLTSGGTYSGSADGLYLITIDNDTASPETFSWSLDGGSVTTGVSITGSAQTLSNGVTVTFAATTGHTNNDFWTIKCTIAMVSDIADSGTELAAQLQGGSDGMDYTVVYSAPMSGTPADTWSRVLILKVRDTNIGGT